MNKFKCTSFRSVILYSLLILFSSQLLFADPYLEVCGGSWCTTKGDAEGYNYICGSDNISFSAVKIGLINPGGPTITYEYQWWKELLEWHNFFGWVWKPYIMTGEVTRVITTNVEGKYYCHVKKYEDGILKADYETGKAQVKSISAQPSFSAQPINPTTVCLGSEATFSVTANQTGNEFQWKRAPFQGGSLTDIPDATSPSYTFTPSSSDDEYYYSCLVTNACNTAGNSSNQAQLIVLSAPVVSPQPGSISTCEKSLTTITVSVTDDYSSLAWYVKPDGGDWTPISDAPAGYTGYNSLELTIQSPTKSHDLNQYKCRASLSTCGWWDDPSTVTTLHVFKEASIISQSHNMPVCENDTAIMNVVAQGDNLIYQWKRSSSPVFTSSTIVGSSNTLNFTPDLAFDGYYYKCELTQSNVCGGTEESTPVKLNITNPPGLLTNPESSEKCLDQNTNFSVTATGTELNYKWQINNGTGFVDLSDTANYSNTQTSTMTISGVRTYQHMKQFRCQISGTCSPSIISEPATLNVNRPPVIIQDPVNDSVCPGESITFSILAEGGASMEYKWKKGGVGITDWVSFNSITLDEVTIFDDQEDILCLVRNECAINNPAESDAAIINVWPPPPKPNLSDEMHLCPGDSIILDPGSGYASYEWNTGALTQTLAVYEAGNYKVTLTNDKGCWIAGKVYVHLDPAIPAIDLGGDRSYCSGKEPTLDAGSGYDVYTWWDGSSGQTFKPVISGTYWVKATNNNTVCEVSDTARIVLAEPFSGDKICIVTVDSATEKNMVVWEKKPNTGIVAYKIYRESTIDQYTEIGTIPYDDLSTFTDLEVSPKNRAYLYKIQAIDTCGNATDLTTTAYHKPIFMKYVSSDAGINLTWTDYEIEDVPDLGDYLTSFEIYRGSDSTDLQLYTEVGSVNDYLDTEASAQENKYWYRVAGVLKEPCNPSTGKKEGTGPYRHSLSNMDDNKKVQGVPDGIGSDATKPLLVYPNPMKDLVRVSFDNRLKDDYTMYIIDISGKIVRIIRHIRTDEFEIQRNNLKPGYYHIELVGKDAFKAKLIVE